MAKTNNKKLFSKYLAKMNQLNKDKNVETFYDAFLNGKNSYIRLSRKGSSKFDPSWIDVIEDVLYDLGTIINNPREVTKVEGNITPIELAKKVNGESVQHLASHTQFIKEIDENGNVIPSKILSHQNVEDIHTYENRFIATFIRQLVLFVEKRYEYIKNNMNLQRDEVLFVKNKTLVNGQEVEIETKITIKQDENDESAVNAREYIERIKNIREYVTYYYSSPFMKAMKTEKNVRRPILQTNIIRKNPKYHHCYEVFLFIEKFDSLGVSYKVDEIYQNLNEEERKKINFLTLSNYLAIQDDEEYETIKRNTRIYKPKVLTSIDDEQFVYGDLLKGPLQFVRMDETYLEAMKNRIRLDLPETPNEAELEYYKDEYKENLNFEFDIEKLNELIDRKHQEILKWEEEVERLIQERNFEEAEILRRELEIEKRFENDLITIKRRKIIEAARSFDEDFEEFKKPLPFNSEMLAPYDYQDIENRKLPEGVLPPKINQNRFFNETAYSGGTTTTPMYFKDYFPEESVSANQEDEFKEGITPIQEELPVDTPIVEEANNENLESSTETPAEVQNEETIEPINEEIPTTEENKSENEEIVKENVEETPKEEIIPEVVETLKEEKKKKEPIVFNVFGDAEEYMVDGHKEEVFISYIDEDEENAEEESNSEVEEAPADSPDEENNIEENIEPEIPEVENENLEEVVEDSEEENEAVSEPKPQIENEEQVEELPQEEPVLEATPNDDVQEEAENEEEPVSEDQIEEPLQEEIPNNEEVIVDEPEYIENEPVEDNLVEEPLKSNDSNEKASNEPKIEKEPVDILKVIPGKFIVKTNKGYYVNDNKFSKNRDDALIFLDFNVANRKKSIYGGKVIKL